MESAQPRLVSSSVAMMLLGSAWLLPSQAMADSDPAPLDIRSLIILAGRKTSDGASKAQSQSGIGIVTFITSITTALVIFAVQTSIFALLRNNLPRILYFPPIGSLVSLPY